MTPSDDLKALSEIERQKIHDDEVRKKKELDEAFKKASHSESFTVFNSVIALTTVICSLAFCVYFLWVNSKPLLFIVICMVIASFVFRGLSKHYFKVGNQKKFELYNKLSGIAGIAVSLFELADLKSSKSRGFLGKVESVTDSLEDTLNTVSESQYRGGVYNDTKYDDVRKRAYGSGLYIYQSMDTDKVLSVVKKALSKASNMKLSKDAFAKINILSMYVRDSVSNKYSESDYDLVLQCLGALHLFLRPLTDIPDFLPLVGHQDDMFVPYCVYAGSNEKLESYKLWKLDQTRTKLVDDALKDTDAIWEMLKENSLKIPGTLETLISKSELKRKECMYLDEHCSSVLLDLHNLLMDYIRGNYVDVPSGYISGMIGTVGYWIMKEDLIPDRLAAFGHADDTIMINVCASKCEEILSNYRSWKSINSILEAQDILTDYLNTVIGDDDECRQSEINRLSKLCTDDSITDINDRARYALRDIL